MVGASFCAEPVRAESMDRFAKAFASCGFRRDAFLPCYGLAESTLLVSGGPAQAQPVVIAVAAGPLEQDQVMIASAAEPDARDFHGRDAAVLRLLDRLRESEAGARFLAIVGPSGAGKSSLVRAGLLPALRDGGLLPADQTFVTELFPGAHPREELEAALARVALRADAQPERQLRRGDRALLEAVDRLLPSKAELVLLADQDTVRFFFEELFPFDKDADFSVDISRYARVRLTVVVNGSDSTVDIFYGTDAHVSGSFSVDTADVHTVLLPELPGTRMSINVRDPDGEQVFVSLFGRQ